MMKKYSIGTKNKIVIGIDQSYADSGIAVVFNGRLMSVTDVKSSNKTSNTEYRTLLYNNLCYIFDKMQKKSWKIDDCQLECIIERIRLRSAKPGEEHFLNFDYIKNVGALNALIVDTADIFGIPVYSVDTRSWKSQVIGTSKPQHNSYGFPDEKWPTIRWCLDEGYGKWITEEASTRKKKAVISMCGKRYTCNDNKADAIGIAMYGFVSSPKLEEEC